MSGKIISTNRKAKYEFNIIEKYEGGIVLCGSEVKASREGKSNIKEAYIRFIKNELYIIGMYIGEYSNAGYSSHNTVQDRKLLLHSRELKKIKKGVEEKGKTLIPLKMYFKNGFIKIEFALAQGKKMWDKRRDKMEKDVSRQIDRQLKRKKFK